MPVIEVQRDSATRTPVQPRVGQTDLECIDELVQQHGAGSVFIDGKAYSAAMKDLETAATDGGPAAAPAVEPQAAAPAAATKKSAAKKSAKGGAQ